MDLFYQSWSYKKVNLFNQTNIYQYLSFMALCSKIPTMSLNPLNCADLPIYNCQNNKMTGLKLLII